MPLPESIFLRKEPYDQSCSSLMLISLLASRHVVVKVATDAGKTLAVMLPLFFFPNKMAIAVTPLKLLQKDNVRLIIRTSHYTFLDLSTGQRVSSVQVPSIAINHDILIPRMTKHYGMYVNIIAGFCETDCKSKSVGVIRKPRRISMICSENFCIFTEATKINCSHQSSGGW
ncbi:hypothetical protein K503DRAFT_122527 [Rhizopogon vinicolor AM-OR11-026]|uniref:DEAD/DEAH box helicase domain-containing protein n=1 Tax=Rhizopogon vinicolor AM-OR11-026 TaxID=1314800 RepID=A0A1B7MES0_9AGAM|nr:hypothetical protein K503DRAFT_122527 [Rhizopogon vinicolor AM-OR11-026]